MNLNDSAKREGEICENTRISHLLLTDYQHFLLSKKMIKEKMFSERNRI